MNEQIQFSSSCKSVLIPVLLYGWKDNNVVEEEDADDGNDIAGETPAGEAIVPSGNFHLRGDEEDQPNHNGPGYSVIEHYRRGREPDGIQDSSCSCSNLLCDIHPREVEEGNAEHCQDKPDTKSSIISELRKVMISFTLDVSRYHL